MSATRTAHVAAHSPDTAWAGEEVLRSGGTAADAAAAMTLAACVAEPLVVSLLSGMHAVHAVSDGVVRAVDGFVDVPASPEGGRLVETEVVFADERVPYTIGGATFGVPALVAGCAALVADHGRLPWAEVLAPARALAASGVVMGAQDAALLVMLEPVMRLDTGAEVFCHPDGELRQAGDRLVLPGIGEVLAQLADEGPQSLVTGDLSRRLAAFCAERGSLVTADDLAAVRAIRHTPPSVVLGRHVVRSRRGLSPLTDWVAHLSRRPAGEADVVSLAAVQQPDVRQVTGTTSLAVVDADGNACAVTASVGLGTGDWFEGSQLNSMLGEVALVAGGLVPRRRMGSMMAPTAVLDRGAVAAVLGSAGGSRIPSAVIRVLHGLVAGGPDAGGLGPAEAVDLPRIHRIGRVVHVEPHLSEADQAALTAAGFEVRRWSTRNHFFGGVSIATPGGACGDPRRDGDARTVVVGS